VSIFFIVEVMPKNGLGLEPGRRDRCVKLFLQCSIANAFLKHLLLSGVAEDKKKDGSGMDVKNSQRK
jgi:hypothetical protein